MEIMGAAAVLYEQIHTYCVKPSYTRNANV